MNDMFFASIGGNGKKRVPATTLVEVSKRLSYVLRHRPDAIGITLDPEGWTNIEVLLSKINVSRVAFDQVVADNDKKRFTVSEDGVKVRAAQGHSIDVDLKLPDVSPPDVLYHGTAKRFLDTIMEQGLLAMKRHAVHMSLNKETAMATGKRHGDPVVLRIDARRMHEDGFKFQVSDNQVWLTDHVPFEYLDLLW